MQLVSHSHDAAGESQSMRCTCASRAPGGCACWRVAGCEFVPETLEVRLEISTAYDGRVRGTRDQRPSTSEDGVLAAAGRMPARRGGEQTRVVKTKLSSRTRARARPADAPARTGSPSGRLRLRDGGDARCGEVLSSRLPSSQTPTGFAPARVSPQRSLCRAQHVCLAPEAAAPPRMCDTHLWQNLPSQSTAGWADSSTRRSAAARADCGG